MSICCVDAAQVSVKVISTSINDLCIGQINIHTCRSSDLQCQRSGVTYGQRRDLQDMPDCKLGAVKFFAKRTWNDPNIFYLNAPNFLRLSMPPFDHLTRKATHTQDINYTDIEILHTIVHLQVKSDLVSGFKDWQQFEGKLLEYSHRRTMFQGQSQ